MRRENSDHAATVTVRRGRHVGWWVDGRSRRGRRVMWTWWPSKGLAHLAARLCARMMGTPAPAL